MITIKEIKGGIRGVFSTKSFEIGQHVYTFNPRYIEHPTQTSIQHNHTAPRYDFLIHKHFEDDIGRYLNHNCDPNACIVSNEHGIHLFTIDSIKKNEEITFDYNTTESKITHPFKCNCHGKTIGKYND